MALLYSFVIPAVSGNSRPILQLLYAFKRSRAVTSWNVNDVTHFFQFPALLH
jgi:hypothetical protein